MQADGEEPGTAARRKALLSIYLNDHLAGATGGLELARRTATAQAGTAAGAPLRQLVSEIATDRGTLLTIMQALGVPVRRHKVAAGWAAEKVGRLKLNGSLWKRSPLSAVIELEGLRVGIEGKRACWQLLLQLARVEHALDATRLEDLITRSGRQADTVERLRREAGAKAFR